MSDSPRARNLFATLVAPTVLGVLLAFMYAAHLVVGTPNPTDGLSALLGTGWLMMLAFVGWAASVVMVAGVSEGG